MLASAWFHALKRDPRPIQPQARRALIAFIDAFGDAAVRLYRCPGRLNLRGMHVDTHGGFVNLITHQRSIVVACAAAENDALTALTAVNADTAYPSIRFNPTHTESKQTGWGAYLQGVVTTLLSQCNRQALTGLQLAVSGDLPAGAGLGSSSALCLATAMALADANAIDLDENALMKTVRAAEWAAGARVGIADPVAMLLGHEKHVYHGLAFEPDLGRHPFKHVAFPPELTIVVIDSTTRRQLGGTSALAYNRNRFAYTAAMRWLHHHGLVATGEGQLLRLAYIGHQQPLELLLRIPNRISWTELDGALHDREVADAYDRYFGHLGPDQRPRTFDLRGPLCFGIAESARAERFAESLERGDFIEAGSLMTLGHDGDRVITRDGKPYCCDLSDTALRRMIKDGTAIWAIPGAYRASSPILDGIVDAVIGAGALGASLTGAGIAGSVVALCRREDAESVMSAARNWLRSDSYAQYAGSESRPSTSEIEAAVCINVSPPPASEITLS